MSFRQRRQAIRLVNRPEGLPIDDVKWLHTQGFKGHSEVPNLATWYRPDGTPLVGRTDAYHLRLYRLKGWPLRPPVIRGPTPQEPRRALPWYAARAKRVLGDADWWVGTATEFVEAAGLPGASPDTAGRRLFKAEVSAALAQEGISVARSHSGKARVLRLERQ